MTGSAPRPWSAPTVEGGVRGTVTVPSSKSATARSLVLAALADAPSTQRGVLSSRDTDLMVAALRGLGVRIEDAGADALRVTPPERFTPGDVHVGLAGTVMRFLPAVAALADGESRFTGDAAASARPNGPLLAGLAQLGVDVDRTPSVPFTVRGRGRVPGRRATIDASGSSQFVSGLLLSAARFDEGLDLHHVGGPVPSATHVRMSVEMLRARGVAVEASDAAWQVTPGPIGARDEVIEPDLTNAAIFLAAGLVTGGSVTVAWPEVTLQAGDDILAALTAMGGHIERSPSTVTASADGLVGTDLDLGNISELTCVVAALAVLADSPTTIRGVAHIRGHETDRLAALASGLGALGASVIETADGLRIEPGPLHGGTFETHADHRLAHTAALVGLRVPGVELDDVSCTTKTLPDFPGLWGRLLGEAP